MGSFLFLDLRPQLATIFLSCCNIQVVFGYLPVEFAYGILADNAGLSAWNTLLMSLVVYAGSAQLIAVGLFAAPTLLVAWKTRGLFVCGERHVDKGMKSEKYHRH